MTKLPNQPSALIRLALADLAAMERRPRITIDMGTWFDSEVDEKGRQDCTVCLAGAVMARSLNELEKASYKERVLKHPDDYGPIIRRKIKSLDFFRTGLIYMAVRIFFFSDDILGGVYNPAKEKVFDRIMNLPPTIEITNYEDNRKKWRKDMRRIIRILEKAGF